MCFYCLGNTGGNFKCVSPVTTHNVFILPTHLFVCWFEINIIGNPDEEIYQKILKERERKKEKRKGRKERRQERKKSNYLN